MQLNGSSRSKFSLQYQRTRLVWTRQDHPVLPSAPVADARRSFFWLVAVALTVLAGVGMSYMQTRFDSADLRNATELVRSYDGGHGRSLEDIVRAQHPGGRLSWDSTIRSGCFGYVRVRCRAEEPGRVATYLFDVDMGSVSIHPANAAGRRALAELDHPGGST